MKRMRARLMGQQVPDGNGPFAVLGEFRPIICDARVVVEPAARMRQGQSHRRHAFGQRKDDNHCVLLPWIARRCIARAGPKIDDLLTIMIDAAHTAKLATLCKVRLEGGFHGHEVRMDSAVHRG